MKRSGLFLVALALLLSSGPTAAADNIIHKYRAGLTAKIYELGLKRRGMTPDQLCVHSIGQSHIDAAWRWRLAQTHDKVYKTWSEAVKHMGMYPDFIFSGSAPQYYEWILEEHPDLFSQIQDREKEGRWEIVGGQWVEPDGNMPDGESFVRQRLLGQRFYLEHFGHMSDIGWMLDSFGYNYNYPQFMAKSGAKYMWTSKLTWNDTTVFPFHNFRWRSPDGSEVITHICPISPLPLFFPFGEIGKYKNTRYLVKPGVELVADYSTLPETIERAMSDEWLNEIGIFYGLGDGGHGPQEIEIMAQQELAEKGYTKFSTAGELFSHIGECRDRLPVWDDEMYLEYHRGVLTTQAWIKRANRESETMLRTAEAIRSAGHALGVRYPYETLKKIWKVVLLNHFHDILPGSSIPEVYDDARLDYAFIRQAANEITYSGLEALAGMIKTNPPSADMDSILVMNALPFERSGLVRIEVPTGKSYEVASGGGEEVLSQEITRGDKKYLVFRAQDMPAAGYRVYYARQTDQPASPSSPASPLASEDETSYLLENELVKVAVDKRTGLLTSMVDKSLDREMIKAPSNKIMAFHDHTREYSAWNISHNYLSNPLPIDEQAEVTLASSGPLYSEIKAVRKSRIRGRVTTYEQRIALVAGDPVVYLDLDADVNMDYALVKLEFNTALHSDTVAADNAYLIYERPTHPQTAAEKAAWETPCQKWIDLSEPELGLALLNRGKYGFSLNEDGTGYRLTVIKAAHYPKASPEAVNVKHHHVWSPFPTLVTDQGAHHVELGLLAHAGTWREARLWEDGYDFNTPMEAVWTREGNGNLPEEGSFWSVESDSVYMGSIKKSEDDDSLVIRLVEAAGKNSTATVTFHLDMRVANAAETDLLEMNPVPVSASGSSFTVSLGPHEIKTIKVEVVR